MYCQEKKKLLEISIFATPVWKEETKARKDRETRERAARNEKWSEVVAQRAREDMLGEGRPLQCAQVLRRAAG